MSYEQALKNISVQASGDLSTRQYRFVKIDTSGQLALSGTAGRPAGVLQDTPSAQGEPGAVAVSGVSKVVAGSALDEGVDVTSDSQGRAVAAATGDEAVGTTLTSGTGAGSLVSVLLRI